MANKDKEGVSLKTGSSEGPMYVRQLSEIEKIYDDEYYRFRRLTQPFEIQLQCVRKFLSITPSLSVFLLSLLSS